MTRSPRAIEQIFIDDLQSRMIARDNFIRVAPLAENEVKTFILELINNPRFSKRKPEDKFYPYTESCINRIIEKFKNSSIDMNPRNVIKFLDIITGTGLNEKMNRIDEKIVDRFDINDTLGIFAHSED